MAIVKNYDVSPELLGDWTYQASAGAQTRENVDRTNAARADQAQLNQQGAIASAQLAQHAQDRNVNAAMQADQNRMRLQANADDNRTALEAKKLEGQQQQQDFQNDAALKSLQADLDARNKALDDLAVPNFLDGPMEEHKQAVGNQRLIGAANQSFDNDLIAKAQTGNKFAMQQAMSRGLFRFSPQQQQRQAELKSAWAQLSDPRLTPEDRARGQMQIAQEMRSIQPELVPEGERTPDINERLEKSTGVWTDPTTGLQYPATFDRSGVVQIVDIPDSLKPSLTPQKKYETDPEFAAKMRADAYQRVFERKKLEFDAQRKASEFDTSAPPPSFSAPTETEIQEELRIGLGNPAPQGFVDSLMGRLRNVGQGLSQQGGALPAAPVGNGAPPAGGGGMTQSAAPQQPQPAAAGPTVQPAPQPTRVQFGDQQHVSTAALTMPGGEQVPLVPVKVAGREVMASVKDGKAAILATGPNGEKMPIAIMDNPESGSSRKNPLKIKRANLAMAGQVLPKDAVLVDEDGTIYEYKEK